MTDVAPLEAILTYGRPELFGTRILPRISVTVAAAITEFQGGSVGLEPKWKIFAKPR